MFFSVFTWFNWLFIWLLIWLFASLFVSAFGSTIIGESGTKVRSPDEEISPAIVDSKSFDDALEIMWEEISSFSMSLSTPKFKLVKLEIKPLLQDNGLVLML